MCKVGPNAYIFSLFLFSPKPFGSQVSVSQCFSGFTALCFPFSSSFFFFLLLLLLVFSLTPAALFTNGTDRDQRESSLSRWSRDSSNGPQSADRDPRESTLSRQSCKLSTVHISHSNPKIFLNLSRYKFLPL